MSKQSFNVSKTYGARVKHYIDCDIKTGEDVRYTNVILDNSKNALTQWKTVGVPVGAKRLKFSYILTESKQKGQYSVFTHPTIRLECLYLNASMLSPNEPNFAYVPSKAHFNVLAFILDEADVVKSLTDFPLNDEFGILDSFYECQTLLNAAIRDMNRDVLAVIYAHLFRMFDRFFDVDFRHFTRLDITQVFAYIRKIYEKGVECMFEDDIYIEEFACLRHIKCPVTRKQDKKRLKQAEQFAKSTIASHVDDMEVELEDDEAEELYGDDSPSSQKKMFLRVDFKRAHELYTEEATKFQKNGGVISEMDEGEADEEEMAFIKKRKHDAIDGPSEEQAQALEEDGLDSSDYIAELQKQVDAMEKRYKAVLKDSSFTVENRKFFKTLLDAEKGKLDRKLKAMALPMSEKHEIQKKNKLRECRNRFSIVLASSVSHKTPIVIAATDYRAIQFRGPSMLDLPYEVWRHIWFKWHLTDMYRTHFEYYITAKNIKDCIADHVAKNRYHFNLSWDNICVVIPKLIASDDIYVIYVPENLNESCYSIVSADEFSSKVGDDKFVACLRFACAAAWIQEHSISQLIGRQIRTFSEREFLSIEIPDPYIWKDRPRVLSEQQIRSIATIINSPLSIVHGKGGSGKSLVAEFAAFIARDTFFKEGCPKGYVFVFTGFKNDTVNTWKETILDSALNTVVTYVRNPETGKMLPVRKIIEYREQKMRAVEDPITKQPVMKFVPGPISVDDDFLCREHGNALFITLDHIYYAHAKPSMGRHGVEKAENIRPLGCKFLFVDETGMAAGHHIQGLAVALKDVNPQSIVLIGDYRQLRPISVGDPYPSLIDNALCGCIQLKQNFRTAFTSVVKALDQVLSRDTAFINNFADNIYVHTVGLIKSSCPGVRSEFHVFNSYIEKFMSVLKEVDPARTNYNNVFAICPYNDYGLVMSMVMDHYYFEDSAATMGDTEKRIIVDLALRLRKDTRYAPTIYKGQRVVFSITDKELGFHMGRIMYVSDILRHAAGYTPEQIKINRQHLRSLDNTKTATKDMQDDKAIAYTIVLVGRSDIDKTGPRKEYFLTTKFGSMQSIFGIIDLGSCISVTRSQGMSIDHVIGVIPEGVLLSTNRVLYVLASRISKSGHMIGEPRAIERMVKTTEKDKNSFLPLLLKSMYNDEELMDKIADINKHIEYTVTTAIT